MIEKYNLGRLPTTDVPDTQAFKSNPQSWRKYAEYIFTVGLMGYVRT